MATLESDTIEVNRLAMNITVVFAAQETVFALQSTLSSLLFGVLTTLTFLSTCLLLRRPRGPLWYRSIQIPLSGTILLYLSTGTYMAAFAWNRANASRIVSEATSGLFSPTYDGTGLPLYSEAVLKQSWMATISLGANVVLGDAIVWWRACVIWRHKAVYWTGPILIALTLGFAAAGAQLNSGLSSLTAIDFVFGADEFSTAAAALSFVTNLTATSLIAYKAWFHRRRMRRYLGMYTTQTRVLKVLALLVESGSIYCIILIFVLLSQSQKYPQRHPTTFSLDAGLYFLYGCLVPLVAIYPTIIIVLTASNSSPLELGLSQVGPEPDYGKQCVPPNGVRLRRCTICGCEGNQDGRDIIERVTSRNSLRSPRQWKPGMCELGMAGEGGQETETSTAHRDSDSFVDVV